jgi:hypothetical protein
VLLQAAVFLLAFLFAPKHGVLAGLRGRDSNQARKELGARP